MTDPVSITTAAWSLATLCIQIVNGIKNVIESTKETKNDLLRLLNQTERVRLYLEMMRGLTSQLSDTKDQELLLPFDPDACQQTIDQLQKIVARIQNEDKSAKIVQAIKLMQRKGEIEKIVKEMHDQEKIIGLVLNFIAANTSVKTKAEIEKLTTRAKVQSEARNPFNQRMKTTNGDATSKNHHFQPTEGPAYTPITWFGQVTRGDQSAEYLDARDVLSDAAWKGQWDRIWASVDAGYQQYGELWVNAPRMKSAERLNELTSWTALHQAAYLCAPYDQVEELLARGALCTLRTSKTDAHFLYGDLTAAEIANGMGFGELARLLAPVVRYNVPHRVLDRLQERLHELIQGQLPEGINAHQLRLPELAVLTELEEPEMWFPIRKDGKLVLGFTIRLDGREVLVRRSTLGDMEGQLFRVRQDDICFIEEAVTFGK